MTTKGLDTTIQEMCLSQSIDVEVAHLLCRVLCRGSLKVGCRIWSYPKNIPRHRDHSSYQIYYSSCQGPSVSPDIKLPPRCASHLSMRREPASVPSPAKTDNTYATRNGLFSQSVFVGRGSPCILVGYDCAWRSFRNIIAITGCEQGLDHATYCGQNPSCVGAPASNYFRSCCQRSIYRINHGDRKSLRTVKSPSFVRTLHGELWVILLQSSV